MTRSSYQNYISDYHPKIVFFYYLSIMILFATLTHPVFLTAGLLMWLIYALHIVKTKALLKMLLFTLPFSLFIIILNPIFVHKGNTPILYYNNIPITLEAFLYGVFISVLLLSFIVLFRTFDKCITPHKFVYLFGKTIPTISLMITMIMRFIPHFNRKLIAITQAQECLGVSTKHGSLKNRIASGSNILSILISFSLEGTIDTADSMKARGYQLKGKTHYNTYTYSPRDIVFLVIIVAFDIFFGTLVALGTYHFTYYPGLTEFTWTLKNIFILLLYMIFMGLPLMINLLEDLRWNLSRSKI